ncbi:hypothetical protein F751_4791 [Auxenochlorella protothecoides]|uniref:Kinetochore protein Sos7 coiled-coil domain-containing protein n=1 Tax=Auxenochlorella protothecoides TaxID=3075 RepID=A0A087SKP4_AUXPR|nr:hypothetical protein F751_4791 [Auxenochlorella protothecoides]KFM26298.1 hypothetical protein F751_4791 [Auxenochlorella protothecoides]
MAQVIGPAVTKRLSFGHASHQASLSPDGPDGIAEAALTSLLATTAQRFDEVEAAARARTDEVGEADLRRLKRQFGSLKNSFLHFEVKESFITSLIEGLPTGTEADQLADFEAEVEATVARLQAVKAGNKALTAEIEGLIEEAGAELERLSRELAVASEEARRLEADLASAASASEDALAATQAARDEASGLSARAGDLAARRTRRGQERAGPDHCADLVRWAAAATELCCALSGVSVLGFREGSIRLRLVTAYPTVAVGLKHDLGALPCRTATHEAELRLDGAMRVTQATLEPPGVPLPKTLAGMPLPAAVQEIMRTVAGHGHRRHLLSSCPAASSTDTALVDASLSLAGGGNVALSLRDTWPGSAVDEVCVTGLAGTRRFMGVDLAQIAGQLSEGR